MTDLDKVRDALAQLRPGDEIRLRLDSGEEVVGIMGSVDTGAVLLEGNREPVDIARITGILIDISTEGPE